MEKIEIGGKWYKLVPIDKEEVIDETLDLTYCYTCETPSIGFKFSVLLDDDGEVWGDTQSVTYYKGKDEKDYWDNPSWIRSVMNGDDDKINEEIKGFLTPKQIKDIKFLLEEVRKKGWMVSS